LQELPPTRIGPPRRWPNPVGGQDPADRAGSPWRQSGQGRGCV
jgi:hypothetical protein